jgi:hypothetical protein
MIPLPQSCILTIVIESEFYFRMKVKHQYYWSDKAKTKSSIWKLLQNKLFYLAKKELRI